MSDDDLERDELEAGDEDEAEELDAADDEVVEEEDEDGLEPDQAADWSAGDSGVGGCEDG